MRFCGCIFPSIFVHVPKGLESKLAEKDFLHIFIKLIFPNVPYYKENKLKGIYVKKKFLM